MVSRKDCLAVVMQFLRKQLRMQPSDELVSPCSFFHIDKYLSNDIDTCSLSIAIVHSVLLQINL